MGLSSAQEVCAHPGKLQAAAPKPRGSLEGNVTAGGRVLSDSYTMQGTDRIVFKYMFMVFITSFIHLHVLLLIIHFWH